MPSSVASTLGLHRRQRDRRVLVALVLDDAGRRRAFGAGLAALRLLARGRPLFIRAPAFGRAVGGHDHFFGREGAAIGGVEIYDVAQQHLAFVERIAPPDEGAHGERALAQPADHHLAAGLDALGDGDLALARQQLDRAHLAQIHAHGIVGAADILVIEIAAGARLALAALFGRRRLVRLLALDDIDALLAQHRQRVFDLLGRHLLGRQRGIHFVVSDVAPLLAFGDHLLDRRLDGIEERRLGRLLARLGCFRRIRRLTRHLCPA
jgi:hypothetical protein